MRTLLVCAILALSFCGLGSQAALIALDTANWTGGRLPSDWQIKVNHGRPEVSACTDAAGPCLHLKSVKSSFALERNVDVDPAQMPYLGWRWKVAELPRGGDFRHTLTHDQGAQVMVAFADRKVISYIWDSTAPKGAEESAGFIPLVHVFAVVCESGAAGLNQWIAENRNLAADYQRAYGGPAPHVKGLRLQINSQHTGTTAESYFGEVAFRATPR